MFGSLLASGMMRKGLFNFIMAAKGACYFRYVSVKITDDDVIRKDGWWREMRWECARGQKRCRREREQTCGERGRQEKWWCCR